MRNIDACFIGGAWARAHGSSANVVMNPATDEAIANVQAGNAEDVNAAVAAAARAQPDWARTPVAERLNVLSALLHELKAASGALAQCITTEMGAPIGFSQAAQLGLPLRNLSLTIDAMRAIEDEKLGTSLVLREPVGVIGAITPWNFPLHQIVAKAAPAMAAGCTVVLKPSEIAPMNAHMLIDLIQKAGVPAGVFNVVFGDGTTGAALAGHPGVDMVSFTGSTRAGREIAKAAAQNVKRCALELGGKSANIILDDADLDKAVPAALGQCFINSGQICAALSRLLVPAKMLEDITVRAVAAAQGWTVGDPMDAATKLGPVATQGQRTRIQAFITKAVADGATVRTGGAAPPRATGAFVSPTILTNVNAGSQISCEEVFGPVLTIHAYADEDDAVREANNTPYGLSGGVWSGDRARAMAVARRMHTGQVLINGANLDLNAPFGGVKQSGYGREYGRYGLEEFFNLKAILGATAN